MTSELEDLGTYVALKSFDVTDAVNQHHVLFKIALHFTDLRTEVTLKSLDVTKSVYICQMSTQALLLCKLPAANLTLVSGTISAMNSSQM